MRVERRRFLACLGAAALPATACRRRSEPAASCAVNAKLDGPGKVLDTDQWSTLRAACSRLVPSDGEPGADEANVTAYIDAQLAAPPVASFRSELAEGLRQMNLLARRFGKPSFVALGHHEQDQVLHQLQRGMPLGRRQDSRHLFLVLLTLTLEGFLCDPVYGGNRDKVGWRFIGFNPRPPRPRCPYRTAG